MTTPPLESLWSLRKSLIPGSRTDGRSRNGPCEFVPGKFKKTFLIGVLPVWERTALNVKGNDFICLAHRVRTEVGDAPLHGAGRLRFPSRFNYTQQVGRQHNLFLGLAQIGKIHGAV